MAPETSVSLASLLTKLTASLDSAEAALPDPASAVPPVDGISLLEVKSELLLAYLQNLVFLLLVRLKNLQGTVVGGDGEGSGDDGDGGQKVDGHDEGTNGISKTSDLADEVVMKLVELRVYLEKGVRPLENRLKYQIDKVLRAAETGARNAVHNQALAKTKHKSKISNVKAGGASCSESDVSDSDADVSSVASDVDELAYRPNPAAFARPATTTSTTSHPRDDPDAGTGIYRPPRITPMAPPIPTTGTSFADKQQRARRPERSHTLDEYIATELSTAPAAEPSIGSTITAGGRKVQSAKEREDAAERRAYEETNFIRLPAAGKKERPGGGRGVFGGDEMRGLGEGVERIARLTAKKRGGGGGGDRDTLGAEREGRSAKRRKFGRR